VPPTKETVSPTAAAVPSGLDVVSVAIGRAVFGAEVAATEGDRIQGLSGREGLAQDTGMLFVYEDRPAGAFWMHGMRFPLDFIWISAACRVVDIHQDVPPPEPGTPDSELTLLQADEPAAYVLEVNAGDVSRYGILPGMVVEFSVSEQGNTYGCE
jgi:uncharacterized membrane protein (UPF0127 family)